MLETFTIAGILNIEFEEEINEFLLEEINLKITNKVELFKSRISDEATSKIIGLNEKNFIIENKNTLFRDFKFEDTTFETFDPNINLKKFLVITEFYCQSLWLIKDNSVQFELAHMIYKNKQYKTIHSNFWNSCYSTSIGKIEKTVFTKDEIIESVDILKLVLSCNFNDKKIENEAIILTSDSTRLSRAFYFLKSARNTRDIGTKISIYCSVLESLFSVSNTELRHRLSESISFFIADIYEERIIIYKHLQTAYDIRSSVVHGDGLQSRFLKNESINLINTAKETDNIIRKCLVKIMQNTDLFDLFTKGKKEEISNYLQNIIFK